MLYILTIYLSQFVRIALDCLQYQYRKGLCKEENILEYLISSEFRNVFQTTRPFFWIKDWNLSEEESGFL